MRKIDWKNPHWWSNAFGAVLVVVGVAVGGPFRLWEEVPTRNAIMSVLLFVGMSTVLAARLIGKDPPPSQPPQK